MSHARHGPNLHDVRRGVEQIRGLSDRLIGIGPFGIGLDAISAWIPGAGAVYSVVAGALLLRQGVRARAPASVLMQMSLLLLLDAALDVPGGNPVTAIADTLFTGHKWAANLLLKHIETKIGPPPPRRGKRRG